MSYGLKNSGIVFLSAMSQSLTCSVVIGGLFNTVLRNDIHLSALKAALNLEEEVWWYLHDFYCWYRTLVRLHGKINTTVLKEILKKHVPNLRTAINQPVVFIQDNTPCHIVKSVKAFLLRRMLLLWSGLLKAQTWILLRMFGSY